MKNAVLSKGMLEKSTVNRQPPNVKDASGGPKGVSMAPKINAEAGHKRVILSEARPNGDTSTYRAPRKEPNTSDPALCGYTKPGKM